MPLFMIIRIDCNQDSPTYANVVAEDGALPGRCLKRFGRMFLHSIQIYAWPSLILKQIGQLSLKSVGYEHGATTSTAVPAAAVTNRNLRNLRRWPTGP